LFSGGADGTVRMWNVFSAQATMILAGHTDTVFDIAVSTDGRYAATASHDRTGKIWDTGSGRALRTLVGHKGRVWGIAFDPDGSRIATASDDETVALWDVSTGRRVKTIHYAGGIAYGVAFSPDGTQLAVAGQSGTSLFDKGLNGLLREFKEHKGWVYRAAFSPDGKKLATTSLDRTTILYDLQHPEQKPITLVGHEKMVGMVAFSHDSTRIATASYDGTVRVWAVTSGDQLMKLDGKCGPIFGVAFGGTDEKLAAGCNDNRVMIWSLAQPAVSSRSHLANLMLLAETLVERDLIPVDCRRYLGIACPTKN
jgi:hypothetical protein